MIAAREVKHVLFEDVAVKWIWEEWELIRFRELWEAGEPIQTIAKVLKTNKRSVGLLVMDQAENGYIKQRPKGLF